MNTRHYIFWIRSYLPASQGTKQQRVNYGAISRSWAEGKHGPTLYLSTSHTYPVRMAWKQKQQHKRNPWGMATIGDHLAVATCPGARAQTEEHEREIKSSLLAFMKRIHNHLPTLHKAEREVWTTVILVAATSLHEKATASQIIPAEEDTIGIMVDSSTHPSLLTQHTSDEGLQNFMIWCKRPTRMLGNIEEATKVLQDFYTPKVKSSTAHTKKLERMVIIEIIGLIQEVPPIDPGSIYKRERWSPDQIQWLRQHQTLAFSCLAPVPELRAGANNCTRDETQHGAQWERGLTAGKGIGRHNISVI